MAQRVKDKIIIDEDRLGDYIEHRDKIKLLKLHNQSESLKKRETVRQAFYHMAVWNKFDVGIIQELFNEDKGSPTIETVVRQRKVNTMGGKL